MRILRINTMQIVAIMAVLFAACSNLNADLVITEVMSDSAHESGLANGDWFEITNTGVASLDLTGYYWDDDGPMGNDGALFGNVQIGGGESIVIVSEDDGSTFAQAWGGGFTALGENDFTGPDTFSGLSGTNGDQIEIWDTDPNSDPAANLVSFVSFGPATEGFSFQWDTLGNFLGLSAVGQNGAFQAIDDGVEGDGDLFDGIDVGSPGIASVPEPSSLAVLVAAALGFGSRRRR